MRRAQFGLVLLATGLAPSFAWAQSSITTEQLAPPSGVSSAPAGIVRAPTPLMPPSTTPAMTRPTAPTLPTAPVNPPTPTLTPPVANTPQSITPSVRAPQPSTAPAPAALGSSLLGHSAPGQTAEPVRPAPDANPIADTIATSQAKTPAAASSKAPTPKPKTTKPAAKKTSTLKKPAAKPKTMAKAKPKTTAKPKLKTPAKPRPAAQPAADGSKPTL